MEDWRSSILLQDRNDRAKQKIVMTRCQARQPAAGHSTLIEKKEENMYKLVLYQIVKGWMWKMVYTRGKTNKVLARSVQTYSSKHHAKRAFERLMCCDWEVG